MWGLLFGSCLIKNVEVLFSASTVLKGLLKKILIFIYTFKQALRKVSASILHSSHITTEGIIYVVQQSVSNK